MIESESEKGKISLGQDTGIFRMWSVGQLWPHFVGEREMGHSVDGRNNNRAAVRMWIEKEIRPRSTKRW